MAMTENQKAYNAKYKLEHYKRIDLKLQNDYYNNILLPAVEKSGLPTVTFIKQAIAHEIERVTQSGPVGDTNTGS